MTLRACILSHSVDSHEGFGRGADRSAAQAALAAGVRMECGSSKVGNMLDLPLGMGYGRGSVLGLIARFDVLSG
jgi:hypothetical protein